MSNEQPSGVKNMLRAVVGALPFVPRGTTVPDRTLTVDELSIDPANVAAYANVTGLRFGDTVPLTYPCALTFPTVMSLVSGFDFPFAAMGSVHVENHITQYRPIAVTDTVSVAVHAENLREHRKGLLVDIVTDINVGNETAWHQVTTFLHQQRTSLSDEPKAAPQKQPKLGPPNAVLRRSGSGAYRRSGPGCGEVLGAVRQARGAARTCGPVREPHVRRVGPHAATPGQGVPAPDGDGDAGLRVSPTPTD